MAQVSARLGDRSAAERPAVPPQPRGAGDVAYGS